MREILDTLFTDGTFWENIHTQLYQNISAITRRSSSYFNSQGRSLNNVLNHTVGNYYRSPIYKVLGGMCSLLMENKPINIRASYRLIPSEEADTLNIANIINYLGNVQTDKINITIQHIPKGKTYLRKVLDSTPGLNRIQQIENLCIQNVYHFIRIYKNFGNTNPWDITIFTDIINEDLIKMIYLMLPNLLNLITLEDIPDAEDYNNKITKLRSIFEYIYNLNVDPNVTNTQSIRETVRSKVLEFANCFDFNTQNLTSFTARLAKAKNDAAERYYTRELETVNNRIKSFEEQLAENYVRKSNIERSLIANKFLTETDVRPFIDTINSSKAIEILSSTDTEIKLRITAPLQYFTPSDFTSYENNTGSAYHRMFNGTPVTQRVLHKIFVTREYKILTQGIITISIREGYNDTPLGLNAQTHTLTNFTEFPNPHLFHHNCWAAARSEMQKNVCEGNFELVVMQMIAAVQSVNIAEHTSFVNGFLNDFKLDSYQNLIHILDQNGKSYTYNEIIDHEYALQKAELLAQAEQTVKNAEQYVQVELPNEDEEE